MSTVDPRRRAAIKGLGAFSLSGAASFLHAQAAWPVKPVRIVHGYDSGSNPDTVARAIQAELSGRLGQPVIIEPKPGAGGRIATAYVATPEPDGYTQMMLTGGDGVLAATDPKLPYDLARDYAFISTVIQFAFVIMVKADSPIKTLAEAIDAAKKNPGKLTFATPGIRTTQHLSGELINTTANISLLHVPFKGNSFQDLIGGRVDRMIAAPSVSTPQIKGGAVRAIAVTGRNRLETLPGVPTVAETLPGFEVTSWLGLAAPVKTPAMVQNRLNAEVRQAVTLETVRARLLAMGGDPVGGSQDEFRARIESDIRKWKELARTARLDG